MRLFRNIQFVYTWLSANSKTCKITKLTYSVPLCMLMLTIIYTPLEIVIESNIHFHFIYKYLIDMLCLFTYCFNSRFCFCFWILSSFCLTFFSTFFYKVQMCRKVWYTKLWNKHVFWSDCRTMSIASIAFIHFCSFAFSLFVFCCLWGRNLLYKK